MNDGLDKAKKPIYKKWWFWVVVSALGLGLISAIIAVGIAATNAIVAANPVVTEQKAETVKISCNKKQQDDPTLAKGETKLSQECVDGEKEIVYEIRTQNGKEIDKKRISEKVVKPAVDEITLVGTKVEAPESEPTPAPAPVNTNTSSGNSSSNSSNTSKDSPGGNGYYNSNGDYVPSPGSGASGATGICNNGEYTYAKNKRGACSKQGGVRQWF